MDEKIEKAFAVANYASTLSNQRRVITEEFNQKFNKYFEALKKDYPIKVNSKLIK